MKTVAMIPARIGSQRLKQKNLQLFLGAPLIEHAINRCLIANCFDEIWISSSDLVFKKFSNNKNVFFHHRPESLGTNIATSEDFVYDFFINNTCDNLIQVHSIAPLLKPEIIREFTETFKSSKCDVLLSCINDQIEVAFNDKPVNFNFNTKQNSQDLTPTQRITWSISGWRKEVFVKAYEKKLCATYHGKINFFPVSQISGHVVKTKEDLDLVNAIGGLV